MKWFSRLAGVAVALALVACGADGDHAGVEAQHVGMKVFMPHVEALPEMPAKGERGQDPQPEDGAPDEVRETGFEPSPEAEAEPEAPCLDCVRETGFVPAPILRLVGVAGGFARLEWTVDASVDRVRVDAIRYGSDGLPVESAAYAVVGQAYFSLPLEELHTIATVTAVDEGGKARSKQSNPVDIPTR